MDEKILKEVSRLKNLPQYKNKTADEMNEIASNNLKKKNADISSKFENPEEQAEAKRLYDQYLEQYPNLTHAQLDVVQDIVVHQINKIYVQGQINKDKKEEKPVHNAYLEQIQDIEKHIFELKEKIGINKEIEVQELTGLQVLDKRFTKYINEHKHEFTTACKECGTLLLLRRRVAGFDCIQHPWYAGRWFFNYEILKDVKEGKLSKEDAWRYMCSAGKGSKTQPAFSKEYCVDYIDHCIKLWPEITALLSNKE